MVIAASAPDEGHQTHKKMEKLAVGMNMAGSGFSMIISNLTIGVIKDGQMKFVSGTNLSVQQCARISWFLWVEKPGVIPSCSRTMLRTDGPVYSWPAWRCVEWWAWAGCVAIVLSQNGSPPNHPERWRTEMLWWPINLFPVNFPINQHLESNIIKFCSEIYDFFLFEDSSWCRRLRVRRSSHPICIALVLVAPWKLRMSTTSAELRDWKWLEQQRNNSSLEGIKNDQICISTTSSSQRRIWRRFQQNGNCIFVEKWFQLSRHFPFVVQGICLNLNRIHGEMKLEVCQSNSQNWPSIIVYFREIHRWTWPNLGKPPRSSWMMLS